MFIWVKILQVSKTSVFINNVLVGGVDCLHIIEKVIIALKVSVFGVFLVCNQSECGEKGPKNLQIRALFR